MSYTWKDIKLATLQKLFAADGNQIVNDESTKDYLAAMPYAANEGLLRLATAGKFITNNISINHRLYKNLIGDDKALSILDATDLTFELPAGRSIYFEYSGYGLTLYKTGSGADTEYGLSGAFGYYHTFKGDLNNDDGGPITLHFVSELPATIKNIAVYETYFPEDNNIPMYGKYIKYDLKTLCPDFYNLFDNSIVYEEGGRPYYLNTTDYYRESDHILVLPSDKQGMYTVYYHAYPTQITALTDDDYVMMIDPELAVLLPLYMASQLYKDDDNGIATTYRNEFEVGLEALINTSFQTGKESFTSEWV